VIDITEILLKVALNTINQTKPIDYRLKQKESEINSKRAD
jgi:hypothetical protein